MILINLTDADGGSDANNPRLRLQSKVKEGKEGEFECSSRCIGEWGEGEEERAGWKYPGHCMHLAK